MTRRQRARGFTLVELMVSLLAGLSIAVAAFALAKQGTKFFQQEYRIANAQFEAMVGFDRLRNDIARAGFLGEPNIQRNPNRCTPVNPGWPTQLRSLAAVRLDAATPADGQDALNGLAPDRITLAGSYASWDLFPVSTVQRVGPTDLVWLDTKSAQVQRIALGNLASLASIFRTNRILRIVDTFGKLEYGLIQSFVVSGSDAYVVLNDTAVAMAYAQDNPRPCTGGGISGYGMGTQASVINFIRYDIRTVSSVGAYAALFAASATGPGDSTRHELVRVEVDALGNEDPTTLEIVSEYAVDLRFALNVVTGYGPNNTDPALQSYSFGDANNYVYGANVVTSPLVPGAERIRSVRARLTVRSREGDRGAGITNASTLFRYQIPGTTTFARARTLVTETALANLGGVTW